MQLIFAVLLCFTLSTITILPIVARTIPNRLRADETRFVQRSKTITNNPEGLQLSDEAGSTHTCQMDCDGQGRLCETIASNVSEKMVCLKNRMQCVAACTNKDLSNVLKKIQKKKEQVETKKQTIKKLGNSHIYTIEEEIKFYPS